MESVGTTETYARIARGANTCWFGASGPLRFSHIFHANAEPVSKGGSAEIAVHERVVGQASPLGFIAFKVRISGSDMSSDIHVENLKFPSDVGGLMQEDVEAWARGRLQCSGQAMTAHLTPAAAKSGIPIPERRPGRDRRR